MGRLSALSNSIQKWLFPALEEELGERREGARIGATERLGGAGQISGAVLLAEGRSSIREQSFVVQGVRAKDFSKKTALRGELVSSEGGTGNIVATEIVKIKALALSAAGASTALALFCSIPSLCVENHQEPRPLEIVDEAAEIMTSMMHTGININEIADQLHVGRVSLFQSFRKRYKCSPGKYFEGLKIAKAKDFKKTLIYA